MKKVLKKIHHYTLPHESNGHKPHSLRHKTLVAYSILMLLIKVSLGFLLFLTYPSPAEFSTITTNRIVELTNQKRQELNLPDLKHSTALDQSAKLKAQDMLKNNYFAHTSPQKIKPWHWFKQVNYNYTFAGENLAMNFIEAEDALDAWMNSPTHRDNIISDNYKEIGVAVAVGQINGKQTTIVVQHFGKTFVNVAGESFSPTSPPIESEQVAGPIDVVSESAQQKVELKQSPNNSLLAKIIKYADLFFMILLGFIILNLILTIIVRIEIQHKPIILHCFFVIFLGLVMVFTRTHFVEHFGNLMQII